MGLVNSRRFPEKSDGKDDFNSWDISEAIEFLKHMEPVVKSCGYTLTVYGSTIKYGAGRDLDLMAMPNGHHHVDSDEFIKAFAKECNGNTGTEINQSFKGSFLAILVPFDEGMQIVDLVVVQTRKIDPLAFPYVV